MINPYRQLCNWKKPELIAKELAKNWGESGLIWLDGDGSNLGRHVTLAVNPIEQVCCRGLPEEPNSSNPFEALRELSPGHWTGWLSYEAGAWLEPNNPWKPDSMATLWIASHDPVLRFDLQKKRLIIEGSTQNKVQQIANWLEKHIPSVESAPTDQELSKKQQSNFIPINTWEWITDKAQYKNNVKSIQQLIKAGDIFQANLTACCRTSFSKENLTLDLYQRLRKKCRAPFSGILIGAEDAQGEAVISTSPERFLKVLPTGEVETRPIKGTRPRGNDSTQDAEMAADLITSPKDRAENIMIVDLLRNDLGKVCQPGSIAIPQLVGLETYPQIHHLTSVINGSLQANKTWVDLLEACWPGGSITGAPKLRACQRLHKLEPTSRGPYCGSFLHVNWDGEFDSNILIRSLILHSSTLRAHAGCGIIADSDPDNEAEELSWKLMPLLQALE